MMSETDARGVVLREFQRPLALESAPVPEPGPGAVVARVELAGVCGTDVHLHHGHLPIPLPVILGHEAVGRVWRLGPGVERDFSGQPLREGDAIVWSSNIPCGHCHWCVVAGERTLCETRKVYGVNQGFDAFPRLSGGWAEAIYLQPGSAIFRLPDDVTPEQVIALGCAGPTAVHGAIDVAGITAGDTVVVQGSGPVGIASAMYAHLAGAARVILVGGPAGRLDLARQLGVGDVHIDIFATPDPAERLRLVLDETPGRRGADVVLECAGVPEAVAEGWEMARRGGTFLALGQYTDRGPTPLNPHVITRKQLRIVGSWGFAEKHYLGHLQALPRLAARFDLPRLITRYALDEANHALADMAAANVMKPVLTVAGWQGGGGGGGTRRPDGPARVVSGH
jgi:threonine dehydrogenase-like Zn-dependent dehydrogenase